MALFTLNLLYIRYLKYFMEVIIINLILIGTINRNSDGDNIIIDRNDVINIIIIVVYVVKY